MWRVSPLCKRLRGQVAQEFKNTVLQCKIPEIWMITPPTMRHFADYSEMCEQSMSNINKKLVREKIHRYKCIKNRQYCRGNPNTGSAALPMTTETVCC